LTIASVKDTVASPTSVSATTASWNITDQPAISLPLFQGADGLPLGVQLVAPPPAGEGLLLALAAQLERAQPWAGRFLGW